MFVWSAGLVKYQEFRCVALSKGVADSAPAEDGPEAPDVLTSEGLRLQQLRLQQHLEAEFDAASQAAKARADALSTQDSNGDQTDAELEV